MKNILLISFMLLLLGCKEEKPDAIKTVTTVNKAESKEEQKQVVEEIEREFPKLNSKNAMDFFLEYEKHNKENKVRMTTDFGVIEIELFNKTKFHRANFIFLTKQKYFNNTQFYRVVDDFIVQAGNSDDKETVIKRTNIGRYLLPTDTKRGYKHDRGVISMPSGEIDNPHKLASPFEFFIVCKKGGAHFLDGDYTIFGRVTKGMDVVDRMSVVDTDDGDWPDKNIFIRNVEIID